MGLLLGLKALGIKPRQEVMASSCSFFKTVHAIISRTHRPVFVDKTWLKAMPKNVSRLTHGQLSPPPPGATRHLCKCEVQVAARGPRRGGRN
ncbi:DegT/DnrJ/EryC1/StrS family aminotransferase (plasmid) [Bradyrhizobium sp. 187]|nr:DegT/DnrJ/EryC1/StrS family aminotransferase [Bradyrhizobium sp. 187]